MEGPPSVKTNNLCAFVLHLTHLTDYLIMIILSSVTVCMAVCIYRYLKVHVYMYTNGCGTGVTFQFSLYSSV